MSHTQKRFLAALVGLVVAASIGVSFSLFLVMTTVSSLVSDIMVASLIIIVPAAFGVIVWELLQRRRWLGLFLIAVIPSLTGIVVLTVIMNMTTTNAGMPTVEDVFNVVLYGALGGQVGQVICIPAASAYWLISHLLLNRLDARPRRLLKQQDLDQTFE